MNVLAAVRLPEQTAPLLLRHCGAHAMLVRRRHWVAAFLAASLALIAAAEVWAQATDDLDALHGQVSRLDGQGKYAEATPIAQRYVALARQKHGEEHMEFAVAIAWLAALYERQGRYAEAEPLFKRSLAIAEKALGPDHP